MLSSLSVSGKHVSCSAKWLYECDKFGECRIGETWNGATCETCSSYWSRTWTHPDSIGRTRHLLYHIYPIAGAWQQNIERLIPRLPLFNGRRIVAVLYDPPGGPIAYRPTPGQDPDNWHIQHPTDPPEAIEAALAGHGIEFVRVQNDPNLREVASFLPLFERIAELNQSGHATLYAHAKGVRRQHGHMAHEWTDVLYEAMLDHWPAVAEILARHPVAGCFKKLGRGWRAEQSRSDWHYSGSWFWFRNADLFGKPDWRTIDQFWSGIEPYPSQHFHHDEAGVVFYEGQVPAMNLYNHRYWQRTVRPQWHRWKQENSARRTVIG